MSCSRKKRQKMAGRDALLLTLMAILISGVTSQSGLVCPYVPPGTGGPCVEACSNDFQCAREQRCCSNGCGHDCMTAVCAPECEIACQPGYGLKKDTYGCSICQCVPLCEGATCFDGEYCDVEQVSCSTGMCPQGVCIPCPPYNCPIGSCPEGWGRRLDSRGCLGCQCYNVCQSFVCPVGQRCVGLPTPCPAGNYHCDPTPTCQPYQICGPVCTIACPQGQELKKDIYGCSTCQCVSLCENHRCSSGYHCEVRQMACTSQWCGFSAVCVWGPYYGGSEARQAWWLSTAVVGLFLIAMTLKED